MNRHLRMLPLVAASIVVALALTAAPASATNNSGDFCFPVRAEMTAYFYGSGCTSPVGLCTTGEVTTRWGNKVIGVANFTAAGVGGGVIGESSVVTPSSAEPATTWAYSGELVISTSIGELTFDDMGVFDTAGGAFTEFDRVVSGTGAFQGASGTLFISGFAFPDGSGFDSDVRGTLCVPGTQRYNAKLFHLFF